LAETGQIRLAQNGDLRLALTEGCDGGWRRIKKGRAVGAGCVERLCFKGLRKGSFPHFIVPPRAGEGGGISHQRGQALRAMSIKSALRAYYEYRQCCMMKSQNPLPLEGRSPAALLRRANM